MSLFYELGGVSADLYVFFFSVFLLWFLNFFCFVAVLYLILLFQPFNVFTLTFYKNLYRFVERFFMMFILIR